MLLRTIPCIGKRRLLTLWQPVSFWQITMKLSPMAVANHIKRKSRRLTRSFIAKAFAENLFGAARPAPAGTLRGIDVLPTSTVQQKLSRAAQIMFTSRGELPNYEAPSTFYEKLVLSKFFAPIPMPSPADKLGCGEFIPEEFSEVAQTIPPVWVGHEPITLELLQSLDLPEGRYFAKSNCGSGTNLSFQWPISEEKRAKLEKYSEGWLTLAHGERAGEWWYGLIRPQNLIEPDYAPDPSASLSDWKFHTGGGRVVAVQLDLDRSGAHRQLIFDRDFNFINEELFFRTGAPIDKPPMFETAVAVAESMARKFEYARIDFYLMEDRLYLGEVTLAPIGGQRLPRSSELDAIMGRAWQSGLFGSGES